MAPPRETEPKKNPKETEQNPNRIRRAAAKHQIPVYASKAVETWLWDRSLHLHQLQRTPGNSHVIGYARRYVSWHVLTNSSTSIFSLHKNTGITSSRIFMKKLANLRFIIAS